MDFNLFESDEDDELLSAAYIEATQQHETNTEHTTFHNDIVPEFHCSGEDTMRIEFTADGFIKSGFIKTLEQTHNTAVEQLTLSAYDYQPKQLSGHSVLTYIFGEACKNVQHLVKCVRGAGTLKPNDNETSGQTPYQRRRQVTQLYHILLHTTDQEQWPVLRTHALRLRKLLNSILDVDTWKLIYYANSCKGNESPVPAYHLLHGVLEWRLLDLCLLYKYEVMATTDSKAALDQFRAQLFRTADDLLLCAVYQYGKKRTTDLLNSTPFSCTCIKEFWLLLQQLILHWSSSIKLCNSMVDEWLEFRLIINQCMRRIKEKLTQLTLTQLDYCQFVNSLIAAFARLHNCNSAGQYQADVKHSDDRFENYELCEQCTQQFLNANPNEEQLRVYIALLTPVLLQYWRPRVNVVILLWEYFHKRLNSSFYVAGAAPAQLAIAADSGRAYLSRYIMLLGETQPDVNLSSYTLHILLLGKTLQQLQHSLQQGNGSIANQQKKLLGRIYSKFSLQKFLTLNEAGIHHIVELFLVLCLSGDIKEVMPNLRDQLLLLEFEKLTPNKQLALAKGHMAMLLLHAKNRWDLSSYIERLLQQLNTVRNDLALSRIFADTLHDIFTHADDNGEHLLIDAWLPNFLNNSTPVEQERALESLHLIIEKFEQRSSNDYNSATTSRAAGNEPLWQALQEHVLPLLRLQFSTGYSNWVPQLAADFCIHALDPKTFQTLYQYFSTTQTTNREAQPQFMLLLLAAASVRSAQIEATTVIQVWLKSLVLLGAQHKLVQSLTRHVVQLPEFRFVTALSADELLQAKEPLCSFIAAVGRRYDNCQNYGERIKLTDKLNVYLHNFDQWLLADVKLEKPELMMRYYSFIAIVIYNCALLVYVKSKPNCFFHVAMTRFILPTHIQMGKPPEGKLPQLIHKIWPVLLQGIGRLNFKSDAYINKTLNDLIQKWTPNFKISTNTKLVARPFIQCIQCDNSNLSLYVFERLTTLFLATQRRQSDPNACLIITIFQEVISTLINGAANQENEDAQHLLTFMKASSLLMLEHIMMVDDIVPSRSMLLTLFKTLIQSNIFQRSEPLRALLLEHLRLLTKKYLAYHTYFFFELLMRLAQISGNVVAELMDFLRVEAQVVEEKRGAGEDPRIRSGLQKLQSTIDAQLATT